MRLHLLTAAAAALLVAAPAPAADLDKYVPESATTYVHIRTKNFMTADVVRKAIPLAVDKYSDQIAGLLQLAKAFNPQAPDIPEEKVKEVLGELKKPEVIAQGFDAAKEFAPDLVIAGSEDDPESFLVLVKCDEAVTAEMVEGFVPLINLGAQGQLKIEKTGEGKNAIFEVAPQQAPVKFYVALPEAGVVCLGAKKGAIETAIKAKDVKINPELKTLIAKRADKDFIFAAGVKGTGDARESYVGSLVLDADISAKVNATAGSADKAKEIVEQVNSGVADIVEKITETLGDGGKGLKAELEKIKAKADGKNVTLEGKISGSEIQKLLKK
jgi:hypothetical protein